MEEQEVVFLMDRFGYAKTVDSNTYFRLEFKEISFLRPQYHALVVADDSHGNQDLPYGKFRDKGIPIDNVSNYDSTREEIVYLCDSEQMRYARLFFESHGLR